MNKLRKRIFAFVIMVSVLGGCSEDTIDIVGFGVVTGKVVDSETFESIENAKITLSPTNNSVFTDVNGEFIITDVPAGDYSAQAEKNNFLAKIEAAAVFVGDTINIVFDMEISTALNKSPTTPELITPNDGTMDLLNEVELSWESTDPEEDELTYAIEIRNDFNSDVDRITDIKDKSYTLHNLKYGAKYFWSIEVTDNINPEVISNVRSFTIKDDPENRYFYVKKEQGNNVIYSASLGDINNEIFNTVQLTNSSLNSWRPRRSSETNLIAFLRTDNNEAHLYTMKTNGDDITKVTSTIPVAGFNLNEMDFSWSPNGSKLLYSSFDKLYAINKDGSGLQIIYETIDGSLITECDWSSDGSKIAIKTNNSNGYNGSILVIDLSGNVLHTVISEVQAALGGVNFSVSGNELLFTRDVSNYQAPDYRQLDTRVFIYNFTEMTFIDVSDEEKESGTNDLDPRFSPNEANIIFVNTSNDGISQKNITKTNLSGNLQRIILFQDAAMPDWE